MDLTDAADSTGSAAQRAERVRRTKGRVAYFRSFGKAGGRLLWRRGTEAPLRFCWVFRFLGKRSRCGCLHVIKTIQMRQAEKEKSYITGMTNFAKLSRFFPGFRQIRRLFSVKERRIRKEERLNCKNFFATVNKKGRTYYKFVTK